MTGEAKERVTLLVLKLVVTHNHMCRQPISTREVRRSIKARNGNLDEALRSLESESLLIRTPDGWIPGSGAWARLGHAESRTRRPSGAQLSYFKALRVLAAHFESEGMHPPYAREKARGVLRPALPAKQRAKLDASLGATDG